jgi:hypothetical protein
VTGAGVPASAEAAGAWKTFAGTAAPVSDRMMLASVRR